MTHEETFIALSEYERRTRATFTHTLVGIEPRNSSTLPTYDQLPDSFELPSNWTKHVNKLITRGQNNSHEFVVPGYNHFFSPDPNRIQFGKAVEGDDHSVDFKSGMKNKVALRLINYLPRGFIRFFDRLPVLLIHNHPTCIVKPEEEESDFVEYSGSPYPSDDDIVCLLTSPLIVLGTITDTHGNLNDIDLLVKCCDSSVIESTEEVGNAYMEAEKKLDEKLDELNSLPSLAGMKTFVSTVVKGYRIGYYSSFDIDSGYHQDITQPGKICMKKVLPSETMEDFLALLE